MTTDLVELLTSLRLLVGFLGEKDQHAWWGGSFLAPTAGAFLDPVFGRTRVLAQYNGVSAAAALVHDERIGVGRVYHLFRLPEDLERAIHLGIEAESETAALEGLFSDAQTAMARLDELSAGDAPFGEGPVRVSLDLRSPEAWRSAAALYRSAFRSNRQVFPFFDERNE